MRVTRHTTPIGNLLAAALVLGASYLPAAAQSGSEAVVCVGGETRTLQTNPIRRVYTEDMEIVYRIGVDIGQRDQMERTLSSELGSYPEVWCAWSDPGDDHAVIISYTGVIRQDLTVDPEDPRFQAFSVGFGEDFDEAETRATTISQRFRSQNDGSGHEVLLRETWSVAEEIAAEVSAPEPNLPEGRICTGSASPEGCWMEVSDHLGCYLWNEAPQDNTTVTWSGGCSNGFAQGNGRESWFQNGGLIQAAEGTYIDGQPHGPWTIYFENGHREVGPYVNGERHGTWTGYDASGDVVGTLRYDNGRRVGGSDDPVALYQSSASRPLAGHGHEAASAPHDGGPP